MFVLLQQRVSREGNVPFPRAVQEGSATDLDRVGIYSRDGRKSHQTRHQDNPKRETNMFENHSHKRPSLWTVLVGQLVTSSSRRTEQIDRYIFNLDWWNCWGFLERETTWEFTAHRRSLHTYTVCCVQRRTQDCRTRTEHSPSNRVNANILTQIHTQAACNLYCVLFYKQYSTWTFPAR